MAALRLCYLNQVQKGSATTTVGAATKAKSRKRQNGDHLPQSGSIETAVLKASHAEGR